MHETKRNDKFSISTLPPEVCDQILVKLSTKPVLRFRCVSKLWCSIIDDPQFSLAYLKNRQNSKDDSHLLVLEPHEKCTQLCTIRSKDTFGMVSKLEVDAVFACFKPTGYVNGVLCLKKYVSETQFVQILLWNPSIRKSLNISLPKFGRSIIRDYLDMDLAFGYDSKTNDYKLIGNLLFQGKPFISKYVRIYTLSSNSWKIAEISDLDLHCLDKDTPKVYLDGVIYRMCIDPEKTTPKGKYPHLMVFDVGNEVSRFVDLPDCERINQYSDKDHERFPVVLGESIALMDMFSDYSNIWVMGESFNWTKRYTISLPLLHKYIFLRADGNLLFAKEGGDVYSYNLESKVEKSLGTRHKNFPLLTDIYMESLVVFKEFDDGRIYTFPLP